MPSSFVPYEISPECIFYARGRHRDAEESLDSPGTAPKCISSCLGCTWASSAGFPVACHAVGDACNGRW